MLQYSGWEVSVLMIGISSSVTILLILLLIAAIFCTYAAWKKKVR